jgi:hypothetical protein
MGFIHAEEYLDEGDVVIVQCSHQCNVRLLDDHNFQSYQRSGQHKYFGGHFKMFPARIVVPHTGHWHVTIDLGGGSANIRYSINYLKQRAA